MPFKAQILYWCGVPLLAAACGCAAAYRDYPCGCVPYGYRAPPPLPYTAYDACPTPIAGCYVTEQPPAIAPVVNAEDRAADTRGGSGTP
jgi:hypothetical protein